MVSSAAGADVVSDAVGAIVSSATGADVDSEAVGAIVSSAAEADVDSEAVGAIVSSSAGANVASEAVGVTVFSAAGADVEGGNVAVGAVVSRAIGANVASPVDVGAAENKEGDGDAPDANTEGLCGTRKEISGLRTEVCRWKPALCTVPPNTTKPGTIRCAVPIA